MADEQVAIEGRIRTYLADSGGSVADPGGRGLTDEMARAIGLDKPATLSALLGQMESDGVITREMRGLRTFRIALTGTDSTEAGASADTPPVATNGSDSGAAPPAPRASYGDTQVKEAPANPTEQLPVATGKAVSLREALSRQAAQPVATEPGLDSAPTVATEPVTAEPDVVEDGAPAAAETPDAPAGKTVSLRDAISRQGKGVPAASAADQSAEASGPAPPPPGRGVSLRDALAARGESAAAPEADHGAPPPRRSRFDGPPTSTRVTTPSPVVAPRPDTRSPVDEPGKKSGSKRAAKAEKAPRVPKPPRAPRRPAVELLTPEVKSPPSKTMVTAIAVAMAGLVLIAVILVVIARGSTHHVPLVLTTPLSADGCAAVTPELASAAFGQAAGVPHFVLGDCVYDDGAQELIVAVYRQNAKALFDAGHSGTVQEIPGLGDGAYYTGSRLRVLKGSNLLEVALVPVTPAPSPKLLAVAQAALQRL
jgi:hypothetical protein